MNITATRTEHIRDTYNIVKQDLKYEDIFDERSKDSIHYEAVELVAINFGLTQQQVEQILFKN